MAVILQQQVILDRPKWAIEGLMECVLRHPEQEALPAAWRDTLRFHLMVNSDLLDLDPLDPTEPMVFARILGDTVRAFEAGQAMHDEAERPALLQALKTVQTVVSRVAPGPA